MWDGCLFPFYLLAVMYVCRHLGVALVLQRKCETYGHNPGQWSHALVTVVLPSHPLSNTGTTLQLPSSTVITLLTAQAVQRPAEGGVSHFVV